MGHPDNLEERIDMNEPPMPPVGYVLLDDIRSSAADRTRIQGVIIALISKRKERYDGHIKPNDPIQTSFMRNTIVDDDTAFVHLILDDLDQIHDERDRDECEILITKPDIRDNITDESQIPTCQGNIFIQQSSLNNSYGSPSTQVSMTSSMTSGMMYHPLSKLLENELRKKPNERTHIRNAISQIILDCMKRDYSKRGNDYTLTRSTGCLRSLGADSGIHSSKEGDDIPPTAMLLDSNG
nr:uncharacterized protein LOC129270705 [Lytechinus pictus]